MGSMASRGHLDFNTGYLHDTPRHEFLTLVINHTEIIVAMVLVSAVAMPVGIVVNYKLFNNVTNEKHLEKGKVIQRIMATYAVIQSIGWPTVISVNFLITIDRMSYNTIPAWLLPYASEVVRFLFVCLRIYVALNSLIIATCRYCFIIHDVKAVQYGIRKIRRILVCLSFAVPLVLSILWCMFLDAPLFRSFLDVLDTLDETRCFVGNNEYKDFYNANNCSETPNQHYI